MQQLAISVQNYNKVANIMEIFGVLIHTDYMLQVVKP